MVRFRGAFAQKFCSKRLGTEHLMLIRFRITNFRSLRDEQELSLVAAFPDGRPDLVHVDGLGIDLLRVAGIYGANAAGKSNVLDALKFMRQAVRGSHRQWRPEQAIPRDTFLLDPAMKREPTRCEAEFIVNGVLYQYGFQVDDDRVLEEWLYAYPKSRRQVWLARNAAAPEPFLFGRELKGSNRTIEALTRKNSLFLSVAAENNHQALLPIYSWFVRNLKFASARERVEQIPLHALEQEADRERFIEMLKLANLGITDFEIRDAEIAGSWTIASPREPDDQTTWIQGWDARELYLKHAGRNGSIALPVERESRGTKAWLAVLEPILEALRQPGILCIDELDASLHPHLAAEVIRIFQDPDRNPGGAQLIFNTHDTNLLGNLLGEQPILHRDQVWFVEKDSEGASHLYPLTDFKPRKAENLERGYLQGRYGAIPFISAQLQPENAEENPE
jgi:predicted ATPase